MAKASAAAEPSMEEILASIRRIISDDGAAPAKPAVLPLAEPDEDGDDDRVSEDDLDRLFAHGSEPAAAADVLDLDEANVEGEEPLDLVEGFAPDEADVAFSDSGPEPEEAEAIEWEEPEPVLPPPRPKAPPRAAAPPPSEPAEEPLVSQRTGASVNAAFGQLTHTILSANARTLDDLVKEMLRPMLKAWLDENLPAVVERLVRAEIERVSRGR